MGKIKYKERSDYFPKDLMRELMEDGKKNNKKKSDTKKSSTTKKKK